MGELVDRDPADASADAVDECLPERSRRRMGDRRHDDFGEVHDAAPAQRTHGERLARVRQLLSGPPFERLLHADRPERLTAVGER